MASETTTTLATFWPLFLSHMQTMIGQSGDGSVQKIRAIIEGEETADQAPIPHIAVQLLSFKAESRTATSKVWLGTIKLRCVTRVSSSDGATGEVIAKAALMSDHLDVFTRPAGMNRGFEDSEYSFTFPTNIQSGGVLWVESLVSFKMNVALGVN